MYEQNTCKKHMKKGSEEKTKFSEISPNNQVITPYHIKLRVQEMTMNKKLTMIGLRNDVIFNSHLGSGAGP